MPCHRWIVIAALVCAGPAGAQDSAWWQTARATVSDILDQGEPDLYLAGYTHHGRDSYTPERIASFNERNAWGVGFGRTLRNDAGDDESVYAFEFSDSHYQTQWMVGYAYQWTAALGPGEASAGWTLQVVSRPDYFHGIPFPLALPLAAIGSQRFRLMASYVPRLSKNKGSGDVLFFFARFRLD